MNRLFFRPDQSGMSKVEAARLTLRYIGIFYTGRYCGIVISKGLQYVMCDNVHGLFCLIALLIL